MQSKINEQEQKYKSRMKEVKLQHRDELAEVSACATAQKPNCTPVIILNFLKIPCKIPTLGY